ncbi:MAG: NADH-quinone oxidoreductase subunit H [Deltaproteobacteria bacterium]|nr:NADH-quinone oxidoreductase subunit H [Deltaproteobacteria bacterium]
MLTMSLKILVPFVLILQILPIFIWMERKGASYIQDRRGPNRANIFGIRLGGMVHTLPDVIKLIFKEDIIPTRANRFIYTIAPFISMTVACMTFAVIPWAAPLTLDSGSFALQALEMNVGILYIFAIASIGVYGVMLAGWGSNNKYSLMGGLRASSQMISYELTLSLSIVGVLILSGSLELGAIVESQSANILSWNFIRQPLGCILFLVAAVAETNRTPFDLPEAEAELVAGYHTEYSSLKFALFYMAEYVNMIIASALIATLFFGGWQVPFISTELLREHADLIIHYSLLAAGVGSILGSIPLFLYKSRVRYGDARDTETKKISIAMFVLGIALVAWRLGAGEFFFEGLAAQIAAAALQLGIFIAKILFFCWFFVWIRWTLPRFRYDQLMQLGWKAMLPLALLNLFITAGVYLLV